jgi:hypothetical protein
MTMCDKELLVGYLYDDVEPVERRTMETHLLACGECRAELKGLRNTRTDLGAWAPSVPELQFQITGRPPSTPERRYWSIAPAWGLAAAAVLVLSVASAIANVEVKIGADGFTVRTGAARMAVTTAGVVDRSSPVAAEAALRRDLVSLSQRLNTLEAAEPPLRPTLAPVKNQPVSPPAGEVLRVVRQMIADSEGRQEQELARRISQVLRDVEGTRRIDLDRTQRALAEVQGVVDTTMIRQRETENHIYRVAQQPPK